jgi:hypothetical protein
MKMVRQNRKPKKVDTEGGGEAPQLIFDPDLPVIVVLPGDRIVAEQEATPNDPIHHMNDGKFVRSKDFDSCHSRHLKISNSSQESNRT